MLDLRSELYFQLLLRTNNLRIKVGTVVTSAVEVGACVAADLKAMFLKLPKLIPGERLEPANSCIDVVLKLGSTRYVIGADKQRHRNTGMFNNGAQVDEVVTIAIIERQHYGRRLHTICSQHLNRVSQ